MLHAGHSDPETADPIPGLMRTLAQQALTPAAIALLLLLGSEPLTISSAVRILSREFPCARSTAWTAVAQLRRIGLITNNPGGIVRVTQLGTLMLSMETNREVIA